MFPIWAQLSEGYRRLRQGNSPLFLSAVPAVCFNLDSQLGPRINGYVQELVNVGIQAFSSITS